MGHSRNAPPANADIAAVVVGALLDPAGHDGRTYRPTGPALLDAEEMAAIIGKVLGRNVRTVPMPQGLYAKAMRSAGYDAFMTAQTRTYVAEHLRGTFALGGPTDHVEQVSGRAAESFEATARSYADLPVAHRGPAQLARVLKNVLRTVVIPGGTQRAQAQQGPGPLTMRLAIDDADWLAAHSPQVPAA